jgi:hypothetical protein
MAASQRRPGTLLAIAALCMTVLPSSLLAQAPASRVVVRDLARELACGPQAVVVAPAPTMRVVGSEEPGRTLFGPRDAVIINAGLAHGVRVGQEYFVRRVVKDQFAMSLSGYTPVSVRTAGWLRIVDVDQEAAIATISEVCDGVLEGDYLEPFVRPVVPMTEPAGEPDYAAPGVIVLGDERRQIGSAGSLMVLDRGTNHGVRAGQRSTIFRMTFDGAGPVIRIGEATAVIVRPDTAVLRIERSRDAVYVGDRVALHK